MKHIGPGKFTLEQFFAGELNGETAQEIREHLAMCTECSSYVTSLEGNRDNFLTEHPFNEFARTAFRVAEIPWYQRLRDWLFRPALFPVYGVALILCIVFPVVLLQKSGSDTTYKGQRELTFVYKRDGVINSGIKNELYREGDQIQILYSYPEKHCVGLLSIDATGTVSFYHPDRNVSVMTVESAGGNGLSFPGSIILDDTKGAELIIALIAVKPLKVNDVELWANKLFNKTKVLSEMENVVTTKSLPHVIETKTLLLKKE